MIEILYIDDEIHNLNTLRVTFRHLYKIHTAKNAFEGLDILKEHDIKLVISDQRMEGMSGTEFLKRVKKLYPDCIRIILTGYSDVDVIMKAINDCGIYRFMLKPWDASEMQQTLRTGLELQKVKKQNKDLLIELSELNKVLKAENSYLKQEVSKNRGLTDIITKNKEYRALLSMVEKVGSTNSTCLIQGETGTGKELVASAIYNFSKLSNKPFIKVNCAALPENLIESELFGHVKGAFTGAISDRVGRFELANNGTIFLDEIGEISLSVQSKLLRIIQEGEMQKLGCNHTLKVETRIIAATNRDLEKSISQGKFREDLYYRLNVFPMRTIPLRKRKEDIPLLCDHFIDKYSFQFGLEKSKISKLGLSKLMSYNWPGNIRELENLIQRHLILEQGKELEFSSWIPEPYQFSEDKDLSLKENEINHIRATLIKTNGKVFGPGGAAEFLEVNPKTLVSRMDRLGIKRK